MSPFDSNEILLSVDPEECYILPSAHFPILRAFNAISKDEIVNTSPTSNNKHEMSRGTCVDTLYKTRLQFISLTGNSNINREERKHRCAYICHAAIAGEILKSDCS